jgi:hypothetical protein
MWILILIPFALQALCIGFDEIHFHHKRGLPRWERLGHPLDTLTLLICFATALYLPYSPENLKIYIAFSLFSCLMVTKDEWIHTKHACGSENWLHALLFLLHPITLTITGLIWPIAQGMPQEFIPTSFYEPDIFSFFLYTQMVFVSIFLLYQVVYWNLLWEQAEDP